MDAQGDVGAPLPSLPTDNTALPQMRRPRELVHASKSKREKRFGVADPAAWEAIHRSLAQQQRLSSFQETDDSPKKRSRQSQLRQSDIPSRTSSQRHNLNRFARELEKYAEAAGAAGKLPVCTPTVSESKISYHTVKPLLAYRDELRAAGLAVTSHDQKEASTPKVKAQSPSRKTHPPATRRRPRGSRGELDGPVSKLSSRSSTSGSFVQFSSSGRRGSYPARTTPVPQSTVIWPAQKPEPKRLFPWLRRRRLSRKSLGHKKLQQDFHAIMYGPSSRSRSRTSETPRPDNELRIQVEEGPKTPAKPVKPLKSGITPKMAPCVALSTVECKQASRDDNVVPLAGQDTIPDQDNMPDPAEQIHMRASLQKKKATGKRTRNVPRPEETEAQAKKDTGKRRRNVPTREVIETIEEEKEPSQSHLDTWLRSPTPPRENQEEMIQTRATPPQSPITPLQDQESSVPYLPYPAKYASGTASSLERALNAVSQRLNKAEEKTGKGFRSRSHQPVLSPKTNHQLKHASPISKVSGLHHSHRLTPHKPAPGEKVIYVNRAMPPVEPAKMQSKPLPPKPLEGSPPRQPEKVVSESPRALPVIPRKPVPNRRLDEPMKGEHDRTKTLEDLDVFFDQDDACINNKDVLKGLQVAVRAAADDVFDAYIRQKTGLRIRRFLADLRAVDETELRALSSLPARARREEGRGIRIPRTELDLTNGKQ
ncbi:hypothetical protein F4780DRAFT_615688 [Xylariomycetidae sp. FL0641]|nr:hypothetical protein F4780DRAFT_615688 [Xylariomycetidae sp. FL0641]